MTCRKNSEELQELAQANLLLPEGIIDFCLNRFSYLSYAYGGKTIGKKEWYFKCSECGSTTKRIQRYKNGEKVTCSCCGKELKFIKTDVLDASDYGEFYCDVIQNYHGKLLSRTFECCKRVSSKLSRYKFAIKEVRRMIEGNSYCLTDFMYDRSFWSNENGDFTLLELDRNFAEYKRGKYIQNKFYEPYQGYNEKVLKELGLQYCQYFEFRKYRNTNIIDYVNLYRDLPKIELLVKAGYISFVKSARLLNLNGKNFEQIFGVSLYWQPYVKKGQISILDIRIIQKFDVKSYEHLLGMRKATKYKMVPEEIRKTKRFCEYIHTASDYLYQDYLRWCEELGYPLSEARYLYPKNLREAHDQMQKEVEKKEKKLQSKAFKEFYEVLKKYIYENGDYIIIPAKSQDELIKESKELCHCVRTYADQMAKKETAIFFLRKAEEKDRPLYTIELKQNKIIQARGKNNCSLDPDAKAFVQKWERKYKLSGY